MFRVMLSVICLLGMGLVASAHADQPNSAPAQTQPGDPGRRADSDVPPNGVIHPGPDASRGKTITPPNVDPGMAVAPPGTPGGNPNVVPK
jgi:hypothetical protein